MRLGHTKSSRPHRGPQRGQGPHPCLQRPRQRLPYSHRAVDTHSPGACSWLPEPTHAGPRGPRETYRHTDMCLWTRGWGVCRDTLLLSSVPWKLDDLLHWGRVQVEDPLPQFRFLRASSGVGVEGRPKPWAQSSPDLPRTFAGPPPPRRPCGEGGSEIQAPVCWRHLTQCRGILKAPLGGGGARSLSDSLWSPFSKKQEIGLGQR